MTPDQLTTLRTDAKLSRTELGLELGFAEKQARQRIYDYESGRRGITTSVATAIRLICENKSK